MSSRISPLILVPLCMALAACGRPATTAPSSSIAGAVDGSAPGNASSGNTGSSDAGPSEGTGPTDAGVVTSVQGSVGGTSLDAQEAFYFLQDDFLSGSGGRIFTLAVSSRSDACDLLKKGDFPANEVDAFVQIPLSGGQAPAAGDYTFQPMLADGGTAPGTFDFAGFESYGAGCLTLQQASANEGILHLSSYTQGQPLDATFTLTFPSESDGDDQLTGQLHATFCDVSPQLQSPTCAP